MFSKTSNETISTRDGANMRVKLLLRAALFMLILGHGLMAFGDTESELKANFIYTFAKSAEVPKDRLGASSPYVICVFGGDTDFVEVLRETTAGKTIGTHQIKVKHAENELGQCNLVYFRGARKRSAEAIHEIPSGILLVGEDQGFLGEGGMISLVTDHGKMRFEINKGALDRGDVRLSPSLLALAKAENESTGTRRVKVNVKPTYPDVARHMAIKGTVQLKVKVSAEGAVRSVESVGGNPILVEAVSNAVKQWHYESTGKESVELVKYTFD